MANKMMTVLEARVPQENWAALLEKAKGLPSLPPGLEQSFLVQSASEPDRWQIIGVWASRETFEAFRQSVGTPPAAGDAPFPRRGAYAHLLRYRSLALRRG